MSGSSERTNACDLRRKPRAFAVAVAFLFVVSAIATALVVSGNPTAPTAQTPPTSATILDRAYQALGTPKALQNAIDALPQATVAAVWGALENHSSSRLLAAESSAGLKLADSSCGTGGDICIAGVAEIALGICAIAGAETLAFACLGGLIVVLAVLAYEILFGETSAGAIGQQVENLAILLVDTEADIQEALGVGIANQLSALNDTSNALGYEAAAAALSQLGNTTFSEPLALAQSGVAGQLAGLLGAQEAGFGQSVGQFLSTASSELGSANSESFSCSVTLGTGLTTPLSPTTPFTECPESTSGTSYGYLNGVMAVGTQTGYTTSDNQYLWLNQSSSYVTIGASGTLTFIPVDGAVPWVNITNTVGTYSVRNFSGPTGAYLVDSTAGIGLIDPLSFPLSSGLILTTGNEVWGVISSPSVATFVPVSGSYGFGIVGLSPPTYTQASVGGTNAGTIGASQNSVAYLFNLAQVAGAQAEVYWETLRDLGYTNANQVPARCLILSPAQLLPNDLTPTQLASLSAANATAMLRIYYALLANLAYTFNSSLTSFTVCGHHPTMPAGGGPVGFGTYAYGYLYVPNAGAVLSAPIPTAPTYVTNAEGSVSGGDSVETSALAVTTDETIAVLITTNGVTSINSVTDTAGNSFARLTSSVDSTSGLYEAVWADNLTAHASATDVIVAALPSAASGGSGIIADVFSHAAHVSVVSLAAAQVRGASGSVPLTWTASADYLTVVAFGASNGATSTTTAPTGGLNSTTAYAGATASYGQTWVGDYAAGAVSISIGFSGVGAYYGTVGYAVAVGGGAQTFGPQEMSVPSAWNVSGILSFAPSIAGFSVPLDTAWLLPDENPSFATAEPFQFNVSGQYALNSLGPEECAGGASDTAANCSLIFSPLSVLDYIGGNSSANLGLTGSAYPTHIDGSGAGFAVYLTACFTAQIGATVTNVSYTESTTGACGFDHNTLNGTVYVACGGGTYAFNLSSCPVPPPVLLIVPNACGGTYLSWIAAPIASAFSGVPFLGGVACAIGELIAFIVIIVIAIVVIYVFVKMIGWSLRRRKKKPAVAKEE